MDTGLRDAVVVITGASGGIGRALALAFAAEGCRLGLLGHANVATLRGWLAGQPFADRAAVAEADVADPDAVLAALERVADRFGRLDVAVANAGAWPPEDVPLAQMPPSRLRRTLEVNLLGAAWTARAFLAQLERSGPRPDGRGASLLFVGSTAGAFGERGHADYAAAKAGLLGLARSLKNEIVDLDPYGRVNVLQPGWTVTHMARPALQAPGRVAAVVRTMPLRQLARADDVARTAVWLSSPRLARHVSGEVLTVAGGMEGRVRWEPDQIDEDAVRARLAPD